MLGKVCDLGAPPGKWRFNEFWTKLRVTSFWVTPFILHFYASVSPRDFRLILLSYLFDKAPSSSNMLFKGTPAILTAVPHSTSQGAKKNMNRIMIKIVGCLLLVAGVGTSAIVDGGGGQPPLCYPKACPTTTIPPK
jgi:hypothetical protein